ncbi:hypothetical protein AURDEDRAFT_130828 [Auricularia subglabra TFB-10046 SS5]|uniref:Uncharacterized protein n=1 Tax=Auricularia subglabra (strain TFB-10046 / SS5) TaxID=717982 RepID=J0LE22_AURST|nr:hypothetical protein AURDEDRAFT_130828 [Auricularia subglabra TFB-10046 SS5]
MERQTVGFNQPTVTDNVPDDPLPSYERSASEELHMLEKLKMIMSLQDQALMVEIEFDVEGGDTLVDSVDSEGSDSETILDPARRFAGSRKRENLEDDAIPLLEKLEDDQGHKTERSDGGGQPIMRIDFVDAQSPQDVRERRAELTWDLIRSRGAAQALATGNWSALVRLCAPVGLVIKLTHMVSREMPVLEELELQYFMHEQHPPPDPRSPAHRLAPFAPKLRRVRVAAPFERDGDQENKPHVAHMFTKWAIPERQKELSGKAGDITSVLETIKCVTVPKTPRLEQICIHGVHIEREQETASAEKAKPAGAGMMQKLNLWIQKQTATEGGPSKLARSAEYQLGSLTKEVQIIWLDGRTESIRCVVADQPKACADYSRSFGTPIGERKAT